MPTWSRRGCATPPSSASSELTVYSFSTENWARPAEEVDRADADVRRADRRPRRPSSTDEGVRMRFIGRRDRRRPERCSERMDRAEAETAGQRPHHAVRRLQLRRPGRDRRCRRELSGRHRGGLPRVAYAPEMHDPDLVDPNQRRAADEQLPAVAVGYLELVFRDELWPDFPRAAFRAALDEYDERTRRFGAAERCPSTRRRPARWWWRGARRRSGGGTGSRRAILVVGSGAGRRADDGRPRRDGLRGRGRRARADLPARALPRCSSGRGPRG